MVSSPLLERITGGDVVTRHLDALVRLDPRLVPVAEIAGDVPVRLSQPGFAGLAKIIISQLLSVASANAIHGRVAGLMGEVSAERFLSLDETALRQCGLSTGKYTTLKTIAAAELAGTLDYDAIALLPETQAIAALTRLKGVGPWTAEIYLLFCLGHADIFPAGDLALQKMVGHALGEAVRPGEKRTRELAAAWSPYRGTAARLMWRYFAALREKEGIAL